MDREKREIRQLKRDIKRAGVKRARLELKRGLADDPEQAHEARIDFGRRASAPMNGLDHDSTRKRAERKTDEG
ncbi:hypothetical protein P12x_003695 [Tundrisphaera lichenicola]|uniref:hypothetical protein n=1 Tax=Tundrisphaera lichenicola TaxID=2029860 RepID=UPI003EBF3D00